MEIIEYSPEWKSRWDSFVENSNNGTVFHTQKFFDYHPVGKFSFNHLIIIDKGNIKAVLPGRVMPDGYYESPIGASYGSLVTDDVRFAEALEMVDLLIEYGKKSNYKGYLLTSAPDIYERTRNQSLDFAMLWRGFKYDLHYISSCIKLDPSEDIMEKFAPTTRRNIRKTLKENWLDVEVNKKYDEFYPILLENKGRHNVKPTHSLEDIYRIDELMPDMMKLFMVYHKGEPIGGSLMFNSNKIVTLCFYNMLKYEYEHTKPIQRVMYEVVKWATESGYRYVDIGVSQDTKAENPMTPSMNLIEFKEKFDARTVMRNTLKLEI
jgi:hypothetical protein